MFSVILFEMSVPNCVSKSLPIPLYDDYAFFYLFSSDVERLLIDMSIIVCSFYWPILGSAEFNLYSHAFFLRAWREM